MGGAREETGAEEEGERTPLWQVVKEKTREQAAQRVCEAGRVIEKDKVFEEGQRVRQRAERKRRRRFGSLLRTLSIS